MNKLKDFLQGTFGVIGYLIYFFIAFIFSYIPLYFLDFNIWVTIAIVLAVEFIPFVTLAMPIFWIWALIDSLFKPIDTFSIILYICFVIYLIIFIVNIVSTKNSQRY